MVQAGVRRGRHLAGGQFLTIMLFWRSDVEAIVQVLEKVRAGKADGVQAFVEEAGGKPGLWKS
jgi:hypothetical protein